MSHDIAQDRHTLCTKRQNSRRGNGHKEQETKIQGGGMDIRNRKPKFKEGEWT